MATEATEDNWLLQGLATLQGCKATRRWTFGPKNALKGFSAVNKAKSCLDAVFQSCPEILIVWDLTSGSDIHFSRTLQKNAWKSPCWEDKEGQDASTYHENSVLRRERTRGGGASWREVVPRSTLLCTAWAVFPLSS